MSLSRQSETSKMTRASDSEIYPCPECGKETMRRLKADCKLLDGVVVPDLDRWHCSSCGQDFFDPEAMDRIAEVRKALRASRRVPRGVPAVKHA